MLRLRWSPECLVHVAVLERLLLGSQVEHDQSHDTDVEQGIRTDADAPSLVLPRTADCEQNSTKRAPNFNSAKFDQTGSLSTGEDLSAFSVSSPQISVMLRISILKRLRPREVQYRHPYVDSES